MKFKTVSRRFMALSLVLLVASCSATRHAAPGPTGSHDLARYVLIVEETAVGQVTHSWKPIKDFDLTKYQHLLSRNHVERRIVPVVWQRDCDEEMKKCLNQCMGHNLNDNWEHLVLPPSRKFGGKHAECRKRCWPFYEDCNKQNAEDAAKAAEVPTVDKAIDWVKRNREELFVGSVVIIAGVAFVVVISGGGGLLLAPALLLASSEAPPERGGIAVKP